MKDWKEKLRKLLIEHDSKTTGGFANDCWNTDCCRYPKKIEKFIHDQIDLAVKESEKAYGNCQKCYGKGYSTEKTSITSYADFRGTDKTTGIMNINLCSCDRGRQLGRLFKRLDEDQLKEKE